MKKLTYILLGFSLLFFTDCRREKSWIIKGRLLESCDNPVPVVGHVLFISSSKSIVNPYIETDHLGNFALPYELDIRQNEYIELRDVNRSYVVGLPKKENIDVGDIFLRYNHFVSLELSVMRTTSALDTIFFSYNQQNGEYRRYITGPFQNQQVLDTFILHDKMIYDKEYYGQRNPIWKGFYLGKFKVNETEVEPVFNEENIECKRYNVGVLVIE